MLGWLADLLLASEREGNPTSGRQATPPPCTPRGLRKSLPGEFPTPGSAACRPPAVAWPPKPHPLPAGRRACPRRAPRGTSRTGVAGIEWMRRDPEPRSGIGDRTHGLEWMETRRGAGPALSARPGTCGRSHLSRSEAGGPRGLEAGARGSGSPLADSPCSRCASPPEAATRSASGRRSRPRWPRRRPRSPCRRRRRAADGREPAGPTRPVLAPGGVAGRRRRAWSAAGDLL